MKLFIRHVINCIILFLLLSALTVGIFSIFVPEMRNLVFEKITGKKIVPEGVIDHPQFGWVEKNYIEIIFNNHTTYNQRIETLKSVNVTSSDYSVKKWGESDVYKLLNEPTQNEYDTIFKTLESDPHVRFIMPLQIMNGEY